MAGTRRWLAWAIFLLSVTPAHSGMGGVATRTSNGWVSTLGNDLTVISTVTANTLTVGVGQPVKGIISGSFNLTPPSIIAAVTTDSVAVVPGLLAGDICFVDSPSIESGIGVMFKTVAAGDQMTLRFFNVTILTINPGNQNFNYLCIRK